MLQFHGLALTTVSHASLMVGVMPVMLAAAAVLFAGERLDWVGWLALFCSTAGVAMVTLGGTRATTGHETPTLAGDLLVITSLIIALAWILLSKKLMKTHSPLVVTAYTIFSGTAMLVIWQLARWLFACMSHANVEPDAVRSSQRESLDGAGDQWNTVHGHNDPLVELGNPSCAGVACGSIFEHRAGARFNPGRETAR